MSYANWIEQNPLRKYRKSMDMTVYEVATTLGVSSQTVNQWEKGTVMPRTENFANIAQYMGVPVSGLLGDWMDWKERR